MRRARKLPLREKIAYGLGDWGNTTTSTIFIFFFAFFLTDVARLPPSLSALVLLVGGIWDAVNDPLIGVLADRVRTRWGRRRPIFLFNALPLAAFFTMLWWVPPGGNLAKAAWYALAYILFDTSFTLMTVPYGALTAELTEDYDERTEVTGWRMATSMLGGLVAAYFVPVIVRGFARPATGYLAAGAGFGLLAMVPYLMLFFSVRERFAASPQPRESLARFVRRHARQPAVPLRCGHLPPVLDDGESRGVAPAVLRHILAAHSGRAGARARRRAGRCARVHPRGRAFVGPPRQAGRIRPGCGLVGGGHVRPGACPGHGNRPRLRACRPCGARRGRRTRHPWSMVPDVVEADEIATGVRHEGAYYGIVVFIQKSGTALVLALSQGILHWTGYRPGEEQSAPALLAIRLLIGAAPAVLLGLSMVLAWRSPLGKSEHEALRVELEKKRASPSA